MSSDNALVDPKEPFKEEEPPREQERTDGSDEGYLSLTALSQEEQKALGMFALFVVTILLSAGLYFVLQHDPDRTKEADLRIDYVFTQLEGQDNLTYTFDLKVLITNTAKGPARNVHIEIAGIDNSAKLTYDRSNNSGFDIPARNTTERSVKLTLPKVGSLKMFVMVFAEDELKLKGYSVVSVEGSGSRRDFRVTYKRDVDQNIDEDGDGKRSDSFQALVFFFALAVIIELTLVVASIRSEHLSSGLTKLVNSKRKK